MSDQIKVEGRVIEALPAGKFHVTIPHSSGEKIILAHLSGKMRKNSIRVVLGDTVEMEMSPYDLTKGRITFRPRN